MEEQVQAAPVSSPSFLLRSDSLFSALGSSSTPPEVIRAVGPGVGPGLGPRVYPGVGPGVDPGLGPE